MDYRDQLQRFLFENALVRGEFIHIEQSFQTIVAQHPYPQPLRQLLGEALCVAGLLSAIIKFNGRLTVQFRGQGKLKLLLAQCNNDFQLRGLAKWEGELSEDELMAALHQGTLTIILDAGTQKSRYQGIVNWRGNSLRESIEGYFRDSEQLATKIFLAVDETAAAGLLLQVLPGSVQHQDGIEKEINQLNFAHIAQLSSALQTADLLQMNYATLLQQLFPEETIRIFKPSDVIFHCSCSRKRGEDAILLLGREEAEAELKDKQTIIVTCDFCNKEYVFDRVDVAAIFEKKSNLPSDIHFN